MTRAERKAQVGPMRYRYRRKTFSADDPIDVWHAARKWLHRKQPDTVSINEFIEPVPQGDGSVRTVCVIVVFYKALTRTR